jgi:hypothetical protein
VNEEWDPVAEMVDFAAVLVIGVIVGMISVLALTVEMLAANR